jgi:hypothetical protein
VFNGPNESEKEFEVIDEEGDVLGSFDDRDDALRCGRAAPWFAGNVRIRRDLRFNIVQVRPPYGSCFDAE